MNERTVSRLCDVPMTRMKIGGDGTHKRLARSGTIERAKSAPRASCPRYFITVSVRIAIDFTPPARLRSMASMAAAYEASLCASKYKTF